MALDAEACPACQDLAFKRSRDVTLSVSDMLERSEKGCLGCGMLLDAIDCGCPTFLKEHGAENPKVTLALCDAGLRLFVPSVNGGWPDIFWEADDPNASFSEDVIPSCLSILPHSGTTAAFERVAAWLAYCSAHHAMCRTPGDGNFIPKRLLDVGSAGEVGKGAPDFVRLVELGTAQPRKSTVPYAALSYCWGGDLTGIVTTTKLTVGAHYRGIPLDALPKSIADAVLVCRGVGIPYLWVDALCIVQDDEDDWRRESSQMDAVYINSHVTIAAHRATSCGDGFLGEQVYGQPDWQRTFTTTLWPRGTRNSQKPGQTKMLLRQNNSPRSWAARAADDQRSSALMRRGWVLQESLLPQRIIHYTEKEMAWECVGSCTCECGHVERDQENTTLLKTHILQGGSVWQEEFPEAVWLRLVEEYTRRSLSRTSDKLVAVSGLAKCLFAGGAEKTTPGQGAMVNSRYLAGLFSSALPWHLLWCAADFTEARGKPEPGRGRPPYRAPTWSWASIDSPVTYDLLKDRQSHIVWHGTETFCEPRIEGDQTGAVVSGQLMIEGALVPVVLMTRAELPINTQGQSTLDARSRRRSFVRGPNGHMEDVFCDFARPIQLKVGDAAHGCWTLQDHWCRKCRPHKKYWNDVEHGCLKIASFFSSIMTATYFLVLERSKQKAAWERVGVGIVETNPDARLRREWRREKRRRREERRGTDSRHSGSDDGQPTYEEQVARWRRSKLDLALFKDARVQKVKII